MNGSEPGDPTQAGSSPVGNTTQSAAPNKAYPFLTPALETDEIGRLGHYRVLRLIGVGGMGYVFEAEEITLHRRVALKVLRPELGADRENRERFLREARAAAAINSDHVVTIYQIVDGDPPYLVMQLLTGVSLQTVIERPDAIILCTAPIILNTALEIARQTAEGLAAAHARGLIHRDIKPANLWLEMKDEKQTNNILDSDFSIPRASSFRIKILDFGLARRTTGETSLTSTGFIVGTPNYMSPEQASGTEIDPRADLFSLGCVLYTMLTGELPFPGTSAMAVMMALANTTPPAVNLKNPGVPKEVAAFVARLLDKNPNQRPQSAREVVVELDELLARLSGNSSLLLPLPAAKMTPAVATPGQLKTALVIGSEGRPQEATVPLAPTLPVAHAFRLRSPLVWVAWSLTIILAGVLVFVAIRKPPAMSEKDTSAEQTAIAEPIVVGVLHSESGRMAAIEKPVIDSTLLAIEELNSAGGVLGRPLKAILEDGKSDPDEFARAAEKLLTVDKAVVIFGCWTSTSRRTVRPIIERHNGLLFFPAQTEGLERSPRIVYLGPAPNQQLIPAIDFLTDTLKKRKVFVVGSDSVFPHTVAQIVKDHLAKKGKPEQFVGEEFLPIASNVTLPTVLKIQRVQPDAIVNAIYGTANIDFFDDLRQQGFTSDKSATVSVSITEHEIKAMNPTKLAGDYLAASYFQVVDRPEGKAFTEKMKAKYGRYTIVTDPMGAAYDAVNLWAKTVNQIGTTDPSAVIKAVRGQEFDGPRDRVKIDPENLYTWLPARIARIRPDGELDLVTSAGLNTRIAPLPFPDTRTPERWSEYLRGLNFRWNGKWQAPHPKVE